MPTRNGEDSIHVLRQSVYSGDFDKYSLAEVLSGIKSKKFELSCEWRNLTKPQTRGDIKSFIRKPPWRVTRQNGRPNCLDRQPSCR